MQFFKSGAPAFILFDSTAQTTNMAQFMRPIGFVPNGYIKFNK